MHVLVLVLWNISRKNRISVFILGIAVEALGMCAVVNMGNRLCI